MSMWKAFTAPFTLVWNYSNVLAPAQNIIKEAQHWSDYVAAVLYLGIAFGVLGFLAIDLSTEFVFTLLAILAVLVAAKYAYYLLF